jgi:TPR repeat protein
MKQWLIHAMIWHFSCVLDSLMAKIFHARNKQEAQVYIQVVEQQAKAGDVAFQYSLGTLYARGASFVPPDDWMALVWMKKASQGGNVTADENISVIISEFCEWHC